MRDYTSMRVSVWLRALGARSEWPHRFQLGAATVQRHIFFSTDTSIILFVHYFSFSNDSRHMFFKMEKLNNLK